jgi:hypothetical protein
MCYGNAKNTQVVSSLLSSHIEDVAQTQPPWAFPFSQYRQITNHDGDEEGFI